MPRPLPEMAALLVRAGFRVRSSKRADCAYCAGNSRGTVAFTSEVAFCHRCHWTASRRALARGLAPRHPAQDNQEKGRHFSAWLKPCPDAAKFASWREARIRELTDRYRALGRKAARAHRVLKIFPECEPAWEALARFYHQRAPLETALDFLTCAKAGRRPEADSTLADVLKFWRTHVL